MNVEQNATIYSPHQNYTIKTSMEESDSPLASYLWLPYVILTFILIAMLVASFVNFHFKYKDRYVKRTAVARGSNSVNQNGDLTAIITQPAKTRRLKMFYGNKVDVSSIIVNSMLDNALQAEKRRRYVVFLEMYASFRENCMQFTSQC